MLLTKDEKTILAGFRKLTAENKIKFINFVFQLSDLPDEDRAEWLNEMLKDLE